MGLHATKFVITVKTISDALLEGGGGGGEVSPALFKNRKKLP